MELKPDSRLRLAAVTMSRIGAGASIPAAAVFAPPGFPGLILLALGVLVLPWRPRLAAGCGLAALATAVFEVLPEAVLLPMLGGGLAAWSYRAGRWAILAAGAFAFGWTASMIYGVLPWDLSGGLFLALSLAALAARPDRGFPALLVAEGHAGAVARRLVPLAFGLPLLAGAAKLAARRSGYFQEGFEIAFLAVLCVAIVLLVLRSACATIRKSENELGRIRTFLEQAQEAATMGCWVSDLAGRGERLWWSPKVLEIFGLPLEEFDGRIQTFFERVHAGDRQAIRDAVQRALERGEPYAIDHRIVRPDGTVRWVHERALIAGGQLIGVVQDITDRKRTEDLLRKARAELEEGIERRTAELRRMEREHRSMLTRLIHAEKLQAVGRLAAGIAHEINTPLQFIGDNVQFLKEVCCEMKPEFADPYVAEQVPRAIDQSLEGIGRVTKIVRALNEFAHPAAEEMAPVDLNQLVERAITVTRNEWKYVAEIRTEFDPDLPHVWAYQGDLNQVLVNILVNAAQAIAEVVGDGSGGKGAITVRTRRDGEQAEIRVSDTGPGIPEEHRRKIFEPFFTTKDVGKGTGQGLAISRSVIVEKHRGSLTFETDPGRGTTFVIRLPIEGAIE